MSKHNCSTAKDDLYSGSLHWTVSGPEAMLCSPGPAGQPVRLFVRGILRRSRAVFCPMFRPFARSADVLHLAVGVEQVIPPVPGDANVLQCLWALREFGSERPTSLRRRGRVGGLALDSGQGALVVAVVCLPAVGAYFAARTGLPHKGGLMET